jgi:small-conductance mechanosensitive channel
MPAEPLAPLFLPVVAVALNLIVVLFCARMRFTAPRTILRCLGFAALTVVMLRAHMTPTQTPDLGASAQYRFARGAVQIVWWLLAASTTMSVVRLYYAINDRTRQERFTLDVVEVVAYLTAAVAIVADVFDIPLKGVLATSGAVAIVLGLALQSTLADLFSGFVINATAPYRVGDRIVLDDGSEGSVREVTWRATHVLKGNHDLIIVPNSAIAKSKVVNASVPARGPRHRGAISGGPGMPPVVGGVGVAAGGRIVCRDRRGAAREHRHEVGRVAGDRLRSVVLCRERPQYRRHTQRVFRRRASAPRSAVAVQ